MAEVPVVWIDGLIGFPICFLFDKTLNDMYSENSGTPPTINQVLVIFGKLLRPLIEQKILTEESGLNRVSFVALMSGTYTYDN